MIALLCSVPLEAETLLATMKQEEALVFGNKTFHRGTLAGRKVVLCPGGMGKANAAHAATLLISQFSPVAMIIFGIGGAYPSSGAQVGNIALASEEIAGDEGVLTREGFQGTRYIGIPLVQTNSASFHNHFPAVSTLVRQAHDALSRSTVPLTVHTGKFVTLSTCTGTREHARELENRYNGLCENMEGAAAVQVAELHGIPWIEVRGISNIVEDRDPAKWNIPAAAKSVQQAINQIIEGWPK